MSRDIDKEVSSDQNIDFHLYINGFQRAGGTPQNFSYNCNIPIRPKRYAFNRVALNSIALPKTYYTIQSGQGIFFLQEGNLPRNTITSPPGCYSRKGFLAQLCVLLNAASAANGNNWIYTTSVSNKNTGPDTGLTTYTVTGAGSANQVKFITQSYSISDQLGLEDNTTYAFTGQSLTTPNIPVFQNEFQIYLHSDMVAETVDILASIFIDSTQGDYTVVRFQATNPKLSARKLQTSNSNVFNFSIQNELNELMDLNGVDISFELLLWHEDDRQEEIIYNLMKQNEILNALLKHMTGIEIQLKDEKKSLEAPKEFNNAISNSKTEHDSVAFRKDKPKQYSIPLQVKSTGA